MKEDIKWISTEDMSFYTHIWSPDNCDIKALVFLVHGSVEHAGRYKAFAEFLTAQGFIVVAPDLRGHGQTGLKNATLGYFSDAPMGWELTVHDLKVIYDQCAVWYPDLGIFIFGHSMGSYLVRCFIKEYQVALRGVVLSGTGAFARGIGHLGIALSKLVMHLKGRQFKSKFLTNLVYANLNRRIDQRQRDFDFLSRDQEIVAQYLQDPLCGYTCSAEYIHEMLIGTQKANAMTMFQLENRNLPLLIISGENDPVGDRNNKGIKQVIKHYRHTLEDVTVNIYSGARHEVLNELNRSEVYEDIQTWLNYKMSGTEKRS